MKHTLEIRVELDDENNAESVLNTNGEMGGSAFRLALIAAIENAANAAVEADVAVGANGELVRDVFSNIDVGKCRLVGGKMHAKTPKQEP